MLKCKGRQILALIYLDCIEDSQKNVTMSKAFFSEMFLNMFKWKWFSQIRPSGSGIDTKNNPKARKILEEELNKK